MLKYVLIWGFVPLFQHLKGVLSVEYMLNPSAMQSAFMMPAEPVMKYMKPASAEQLRVLLFTMGNMSTGVNPEACAEALGIPLENVTDALDFWCEAGALLRVGEEISFEPAAKKRTVAKPESAKPSREEIAMMGQTDEKIIFLLREAELKLGRPLRFSEMQTLVCLYADENFEVSVILMLVEYAISEGKPSIGFINATARAWQSAGVDSVAAAEEQIERVGRQKSAWAIVERAFGIEHRKPSAKELEFCEKWVIEWKFSRDMLKEAYDSCVDSKTKLSMPYINKILESWHQKGYAKPEQTRAKATKANSQPARKPSYDKALFEKMLNSDD